MLGAWNALQEFVEYQWSSVNTAEHEYIIWDASIDVELLILIDGLVEVGVVFF